MDWLELHIDTSHEGIDRVSELLSSLGIDSIVIDDEVDFNDFLENNRAYWDYVDEKLQNDMRNRSRITFYLPRNASAAEVATEVQVALARLREERADLAPLSIYSKHVRDADWENNWKRFYRPIEIGTRLKVVPSWERAPVGDRIPLFLNPGLTFGTGSHATTRLCLTFLDKYIRGGESVLDLGCGSGILSLAALRLGAKFAFACDIDDKCETVTYENASLNAIGTDRFRFRIGNVLTDPTLVEQRDGGYNVVIANIVADVILALAPHVRPYLADGGLFICSGIIDNRAEETEAGLLAAGWTIVEKQQEDGWFAFLCQ